MLQNEHKNIIKSFHKTPNKQSNSQQYCDQLINENQYKKNKTKQSISGFNTQPISRKNSPQTNQRKYHVRSGLNLHRKYINKNQQLSIQQKSVNSIFKRRVNSQSKASKPKLLIQNINTQSFKNNSQFNKNNTQVIKNSQSQKIKINFAKKLIQELKKQTFKRRPNSNSRYSSNNSINNAKSVQLSDRKNSIKLMNRQKLIQNSIQKLKPSFNINQVKFYSSKKSINKINTQSKTQMKSNYFNKSRQKANRLQQKISTQLQRTIRPQNQILNKMIKKSSQPLYSYHQYIKGSNQNTYQIKLNFLNQYLSITQKSQIYAHIDFQAFKLLQSIYLCLIDIFNIHISSPKISNSIKSTKQPFNYDIIHQYVCVYFQTYSKIKIQFILSEILFKNIKRKLIQYFLMQRIVFYFIHQLTSQQQITQDILNLKKIVTFLKLSQQILTIIMNMLLQDTKNIKTTQDTLIDTFKSLRLTRQFDKRLPSIKQTLQSINFTKRQNLQTNFTNLIDSLLQLLMSIDKEESSDIITLFKLEQFFNWTHLMIPPLFYLPMNPCKPYTLIIDLDGTLVFYNQQTRILKYRPYMDRFLASMQKHFQLVIFSSHPKQRTDIIVRQIQRDDHIFAYRLYKSHMVFQQGSLRKNIGYLGRNLQKLVFIDDEDKNTQWLPSNSYKIKPFTGDKQDKQLLNLSDWLISLIQTQPADLRGKLKKPQAVLDQIVQIDQISSTIQPSIQYLEEQMTHIERKNK